MNWKPTGSDSTPDGWQTTNTARDVSGVLRRWWWVPIVGTITVAAVVVAITDEPDVHPGVRQSVDMMEADGDCRGLQEAFDRHDEADTLDYIDDALRDAGCYD